MSHVVIIGASVSSHDIALRLRDKENSCAITLISEEGYPAYDHLKLADFISGVVQEKDIFLCSEDLYASRNIEFLKNRKVGALNTQKKLVYFKDRGSLAYDLLILASGRSPSLPEIPGAKKEGAFRLYTLDDAKDLLKRYISETVCVCGSDTFALKVAEAVSLRYKVEVKLVCGSSFYPASMPKNVELLRDSVTELIGEGQVQAVKLKSGKAFGASAVLFMDDYRSNIDFLKNTDVQVNNDLVVTDSSMRTTAKDVFACGSLAGKDSVIISMMLVDSIISHMKGEICQTL